MIIPNDPADDNKRIMYIGIGIGCGVIFVGVVVLIIVLVIRKDRKDK